MLKLQIKNIINLTIKTKTVGISILWFCEENDIEPNSHDFPAESMNAASIFQVQVMVAFDQQP